MVYYTRTLISALLVLVTGGISRGEVVLPHILSSNMVLQRNAPVTFWGWADANERIILQFNAKKITVKANQDGNWKAVFPPMEAGGPYTLDIRGRNSIRLDNILIGEVWICSGQSNMEWPLAQSQNGRQEVSQANYPEIRVFSVPKRIAVTPARDFPQGTWQVCSPVSMEHFSAVGYFFGRELFRHLDVPIGLINSSWGGTMIEPWISVDALAGMPQYKERIDKLEAINVQELQKEQEERIEKVRQLITGNTDGLVNGKALWADEKLEDNGWLEMKVPGLWEGTLLPGFDGVVWYRFALDIPHELLHSAWTLSLGKIDDNDMTWVNGVLIGKTSKYDKERYYEVPESVIKSGRNVIAVRIEDTGGGGGFWSPDSALYLSCNQKRIPLSGTWKFKISPVNVSFNDAIGEPNDYVSGLYNAMIHPLLQFPATGAIWYQGESNAENAYLYRQLLPLMINNWRDKMKNPGLAFLMVQLANYKQAKEQPENSDWAEVREAQLMALSIPKTGMAVTIDIGDASDIHPRNKQDVGFRLALAARTIVYGQQVVFSGPIYKSMQVKDHVIELAFDHVGSGLMAKDKYGYLRGFSIAGEDQQFHWAQARIMDDKVVVSSPVIQNPVAVRYAWADNPEDANLFNLEGLPASPFRTDNWKGITENWKP